MRTFCGLRRISQFLPKYDTNVTLVELNKLGSRPLIGSEGLQTRNVRQVILHKDVINRSKHEKLQKAGSMGSQPQLSPVTEETHPDMPVTSMINPYEKPYKKCIICEHNIELDYKNVRLLSQFVSPYTGMIYGRQHTGLCQYMQRRVSKLINRARIFGFMPYRNKTPQFLHDPKLFDPFAPKRSR